MRRGNKQGPDVDTGRTGTEAMKYKNLAGRGTIREEIL